MFPAWLEVAAGAGAPWGGLAHSPTTQHHPPNYSKRRPRPHTGAQMPHGGQIQLTSLIEAAPSTKGSEAKSREQANSSILQSWGREQEKPKATLCWRISQWQPSEEEDPGRCPPSKQQRQDCVWSHRCVHLGLALSAALEGCAPGQSSVVWSHLLNSALCPTDPTSDSSTLAICRLTPDFPDLVCAGSLPIPHTSSAKGYLSPMLVN